VEQKTPAHGTAFWRLPRSVSESDDSAIIHTPGPEHLLVARELAAKAATIIPATFDKVLPRGYTVAGSALVMARFEMIGTCGHALYGRHRYWGAKETTVFLRDIKEGWLTELGVYMRWQLRLDPVANATFQHALVHLHEEAMQRLKTN
jgi:hypothetical protein